MVTCGLNVDKSSIVSTYVKRICSNLGCSVDYVYVTNLIKNFFYQLPRTIKQNEQIDVIELFTPYWLDLLRTELADYPIHVPVITLGKSIQQEISMEGRDLKHYWGHRVNWDKTMNFGDFT